jgi:hypothetical protein
MNTHSLHFWPVVCGPGHVHYCYTVAPVCCRPVYFARAGFIGHGGGFAVGGLLCLAVAVALIVGLCGRPEKKD